MPRRVCLAPRPAFYHQPTIRASPNISVPACSWPRTGAIAGCAASTIPAAAPWSTTGLPSLKTELEGHGFDKLMLVGPPPPRAVDTENFTPREPGTDARP